MSDRNWGIIAAAGLGVVSFSAVGGFMLAAQMYDQHEERVGGKPAPAQHRNHPQQSGIDRAGLPGFVERTISNPEPQSGKDNEKRDLAAQEATATFAFWMVLVAALQTIVAAVGIYYIRRTIRQGQESLQHARTISFEQLRAYVGILPQETELEEMQGGWRFQMKLKNYGHTPANDFQVSLVAFYSAFPVPKPGVPPFREGKLPLRSNPLMPGQTRTFWTGVIYVTEAQKEAIENFRGCVLTRMEIAYTAIGGERIECPPILGIYFAGSGKRTAKFDEDRHAISGANWAFRPVEGEEGPEDVANQPPLL